jgi:hypothetical protein
MMNFQGKSTFIACGRSLKFAFLVGFENGQQLFTSFHPKASLIASHAVCAWTAFALFSNVPSNNRISIHLHDSISGVAL